MSVAIYLVVHPRGTLLWDAGVIRDERIQPGGTTDFRATVKKTLKGQAGEIGYKPSDITYLALSHNYITETDLSRRRRALRGVHAAGAKGGPR